jgi:hypothetical protein
MDTVLAIVLGTALSVWLTLATGGALGDAVSAGGLAARLGVLALVAGRGLGGRVVVRGHVEDETQADKDFPDGLRVTNEKG